MHEGAASPSQPMQQNRPTGRVLAFIARPASRIEAFFDQGLELGRRLGGRVDDPSEAVALEVAFAAALREQLAARERPACPVVDLAAWRAARIS